MTDQFDSTSQRASAVSVVVAILVILLGLLVIALPVVPSIGFVLGIGLVMIAAAAVHFVNTLRSSGIRQILWNLLVSLFYLVAGIYLVVHPVLGLAGLTLALSIFFLAKGIGDIVAYFSGSRTGLSGWVLLDGVVTLLLGMMIWSRWPVSSLWAVGTLVGVGILFSGVTRLMIVLASRRLMSSPGDRPSRGQRAA